MAKRRSEKRVMAEAVKWRTRDAELNSIAPSIIVTPLANVAELPVRGRGAFIPGSTILIDGGAAASYFTAR